ncbi:DUF2487 family protein [Planomicrobium sp. YIM 101495]|nr:DUF2487 family protein [Planomicrobium sp. YIM 101495]MTD30054.1 DUF2487 family protein [Planomicrobium sp. YIM 101495]
MHYTGKDIAQYIDQKEYVDTAVVPLIELDASAGGMRASAGASEYMQLLTALLEKQFKGRMLLFPPITYAKKADRIRLAEELKAEMDGTDFKHIFYMTADVSWKDSGQLENVLWLPAIPIESMDASFRKSVMEDQLRQVLPLFTKRWTNPS